MFSITLLTAFSIFVLIAPPGPLARLLDIRPIPLNARFSILFAALLNAVLCGALERWAPLAAAVTYVSRLIKTRRKRIVREGKLYKAVEGGMRWWHLVRGLYDIHKYHFGHLISWMENDLTGKRIMTRVHNFTGIDARQCVTTRVTITYLTCCLLASCQRLSLIEWMCLSELSNPI